MDLLPGLKVINDTTETNASIGSIARFCTPECEVLEGLVYKKQPYTRIKLRNKSLGIISLKILNNHG